MSVKTLEGDVIIRGDLTINTNNELDVDDPNDFEIELMGNWTNDGDFDQHQGDVSFTGSASQTLISGGTVEDFFNFTVNNTAVAGIIIQDDISCSNLMTFIDGIVFRSIANTEVVRILTGGGVTGASDASYVNGQVEKVGSIQFDFPIGKNSLHRPISISAPTIAGTGFIAEYFQIDPHPTFNHLSFDPSLNHISSCEYWILDQSNATTGNSTVTLPWSSSTSCSVNMMADLRVARWDGAVWQNEGNGGTTGTNTAGTIISSAAVMSFSPFTLASTSIFNPLPITLLYFDVQLNEASEVDLTWVTETEIENDYFTIERSEHGDIFEELLHVDGAGFSLSTNDYSAVDRIPFFGWSYYRLKQTDFNGDYTYSKIKSVYRGYNFNLFPNPINEGGNLILHVPNEVEESLVDIYTSNGQLIQSIQLNEGLNEIPVTKFSKGVYTFRIHSKEVVTNLKLVVK